MLSLERSKRPSLSITFLEKTLSSQVTLESIVQNRWEDISARTNSTLKSQKTISIDNQTGIAIEYHAELKTFPNAYYMEIMVINNQALLDILIFAKDKETFDIGFDKIEKVLNEVEIK